MVVLEALSSSLAIISNDVYAIKEMCINNYNGYLLNPPISCWDKYLPSKELYKTKDFNEEIKSILN